ncbi:hypothetical protein ADUPG1_009712 [Aduncisulcus paluster]|uniref:Uncharacterized protein n=1 Tax=Aduncisulcus paluster TaxID=2918883 RepID=A0ABQ5KWL2_9EUKA|nr:hypothetical protein ADUPG1_009712 [Aduncisulcus paluster]
MSSPSVSQGVNRSETLSLTEDQIQPPIAPFIPTIGIPSQPLGISVISDGQRLPPFPFTLETDEASLPSNKRELFDYIKFISAGQRATLCSVRSIQKEFRKSFLDLGTKMKEIFDTLNDLYRRQSDIERHIVEQNDPEKLTPERADTLRHIISSYDKSFDHLIDRAVLFLLQDFLNPSSTEATEVKYFLLKAIDSFELSHPLRQRFIRLTVLFLLQDFLNPSSTEATEVKYFLLKAIDSFELSHPLRQRFIRLSSLEHDRLILSLISRVRVKYGNVKKYTYLSRKAWKRCFSETDLWTSNLDSWIDEVREDEAVAQRRRRRGGRGRDRNVRRSQTRTEASVGGADRRSSEQDDSLVDDLVREHRTQRILAETNDSRGMGPPNRHAYWGEGDTSG